MRLNGNVKKIKNQDKVEGQKVTNNKVYKEMFLHTSLLGPVRRTKTSSNKFLPNNLITL